MTIKVTLLTENDKHVSDEVSTEEIEAKAKRAWEWVFSSFLMASDDPSEKVTVESCELIER